MKILHIDTGTVWRGGQRQVLTLHQGLLNRGVDSLLLCNQQGELYKKGSQQVANTCIGFDFLGEFSRNTRLQIEHQVNSYQPDLIHCHDSHAVALGTRYYKQCTIFHTRRVSYPIKWLSRYLKYRNIHQHICVSEDIQRYMAHIFTNTTTIHSCIDIRRFNISLQSSPFNQSGEKNLLYVGAFTDQKGIDVLLKAFAMTCKKHPTTMLHMIGDGELFHPMKLLAKDLGISHHTIFYGAQDKVEKFYMSSDIVVCPSISGEGSSGVIKEGMAAGKPVVASDLEANKELIDHNVNGILFKSRDINSLSQKLDKLIEGKKQLSSSAIREKISHFDCSNTVLMHIELYQKQLLINNSP